MLAKRKGASREGWSEGSVEQSCDLTNRNRIEGMTGWTSWLGTAKSTSIEALWCRSGGRAAVITGQAERHFYRDQRDPEPLTGNWLS